MHDAIHEVRDTHYVQIVYIVDFNTLLKQRCIHLSVYSADKIHKHSCRLFWVPHRRHLDLTTTAH